MTCIHPTAIIESGADLDDTVQIGPYAVIRAHVRIGPHTIVGSHTIIEGYTTIGQHNQIGHLTALGGKPQDMKYAGEPTRLEIGDRNTIREFTTIHTGTLQNNGVTCIGDENWIMTYVHIAHDCQVGNHTIFSSNAQIAGHVSVGDWAILGGMSGVHQFVHIGEHSFLGGASVLVRDLPPYVMAAGEKAHPHGVNIEGLRRRGFTVDAISALRAAYRILYKNGLSLDEAKLKLRELAKQGTDGDAPVSVFLRFIESAKRGIVR
ncbi:acyl-ACP--UDP-N-acetylglucosamine O-acyltransferase [Candidatus Vallotia cooleyia]|uniref:acyl-ACP--UDP-N-acetylglucosamine O-acyltransferase n=1 Tax=Candidatus Vallotiella adelgis TaxID=1177211 RepID=UPI001D02CE60|nr:acyl-ACP--UDP-N-acetylglucosamine O-acyltransferase [Candidatus Vallotia cooleyia]UDG81895.1 Acyl-[acyl-carrier-protein]--UDP-N-acetylglucosamine O-acyltransferase [Candidatus Vallotia cooleyia]